MDDVTDVVFRSVIADCAPPDMFFTEFVNVDGLCSRGRANIIHKLSINEDKDHHIVAQIWGKVPANYRTVASELAGMGFHGVDINMGCPAKNEVKNGCCSALINNRDLAREIILATQEGAGDLPVSVKTRLGWNEIDFSWHEFLLGFKLNMLTIHMRTRKEMSKVPAHWDIFPQIVALRDKISPSTKLVINGDIDDYAHGLEVAQANRSRRRHDRSWYIQKPVLFCRGRSLARHSQKRTHRPLQKAGRSIQRHLVRCQKKPSGSQKVLQSLYQRFRWRHQSSATRSCAPQPHPKFLQFWPDYLES
jgi:tRNA-dihydrouridine synthase